MLSDLMLLVVGLALLIKGGDLFVTAAVRIAGFLRLPNVVVGSTIVSLATTVPEMVVAIMAAARGNAGLALGNSIGSCVCNIGLIVGVMAVIGEVRIHPGALRTALVTMFGLGVVLLAMTYDLALQRWEGALLFMAGAGYFAYDLMSAVRRPEIDAAAAAAGPVSSGWTAWLQTRRGTAVQFTVAAGLVVLASRLVVDAAVNVATVLGIPPLVIGLTVVALATSLPELATAIGSARRKVADLAVGNITGANIANLSLIVGTAAVISPSPIAMSRVTQRFDFPAMLALMGLLVWVLSTRNRIMRREGVILLAAYVLYIAVVVILALRD